MLDRSFPDGTSKTIFFAERYSSCGATGLPLSDENVLNYSSGWASASWDGFRPVFCVNNELHRPELPGYHPCCMFQETPHPTNNCDNGRAHTPHSGAMNVAVADGSVRSISTDISETTWVYACDPRDGQVISEDW